MRCRSMFLLFLLEEKEWVWTRPKEQRSMTSYSWYTNRGMDRSTCQRDSVVATLAWHPKGSVLIIMILLRNIIWNLWLGTFYGPPTLLAQIPCCATSQSVLVTLFHFICLALMMDLDVHSETHIRICTENE